MSWKKELKAYWDREPLTVVAVLSGGVMALTGLYNAVSAAKGRRAYAKQVNYRVKNKK